jgi:hypothetical protein
LVEGDAAAADNHLVETSELLRKLGDRPYGLARLALCACLADTAFAVA